MSWVDEHKAAWEREYPDRDVSTLQPLVRLARLGLLLEEFQADVLRPFDLREGDYGVLAALRRSGKPYRLSPGELTNELHRSSGGMTKIVDRLEARGFVDRGPDPSDRRASKVGLTAAGLTVQEKIFRAFLDESGVLLSPLGPRGGARTDRALAQLLDAFEVWWSVREEQGAA